LTWSTLLQVAPNKLNRGPNIWA